MNIVDAAMMLAIEYHGGDRNKHDGEMYILHLARVWMNVRDAGGDEIQQAIAWLHDSIEDTVLTYGTLEQRLCDLHTFGLNVAKVVIGVRAMTKIKGETNEEYYRRVREVEDARFVKLNGDVVDNFRRNHQIKDDETRLRMAKKYSLAMDMLS